MTTSTTPRSYTIKEAAALTGLPASTLRYYESIGVVAPVSRGSTSGHRIYDDTDLDQLMGVACLAATGMSVADMRSYVANGSLGPVAAQDQIALLSGQQRRLAAEAEQIKIRQRYVRIKIDYWTAVEEGDDARAGLLAGQARTLADELRDARKQ